MIVGRTLDSRLRGNDGPLPLQPLFEIHLPSAFDYRGVPDIRSKIGRIVPQHGVRLPMKFASVWYILLPSSGHGTGLFTASKMRGMTC